jgi:hypothetical protein
VERSFAACLRLLDPEQWKVEAHTIDELLADPDATVSTNSGDKPARTKDGDSTLAPGESACVGPGDTAYVGGEMVVGPVKVHSFEPVTLTASKPKAKGVGAQR